MSYWLILAQFGAALFGYFVPLSTTRAKIAACVVAAVIFFLAVAAQKEKDAEEWRTRSTGTLHSPSKSAATEAILSFGAPPLKIKPPPGTNELFRIPGRHVPLTDKIALRMADGEAKLSLTIRDYDDRVLAVIKDNQWQLMPWVGNRNFNDYALEVMDNMNAILFQIAIVGNEARFAGRLTPDMYIIPYLGKYDCLFRYPSALHRGQLAETPSEDCIARKPDQ